MALLDGSLDDFRLALQPLPVRFDAERSSPVIQVWQVQADVRGLEHLNNGPQ